MVLLPRIEDCLPPLESSPSKRFSPSKRKQYYINKAVRNSDLIPKAKGRKSLQRLENTRYLMTLLERDECGGEEAELAHAATPSIFAEACNNETYVEIWNDFMNRSGEEQERVLLYLEEEARKKQERKLPVKNKEKWKGDAGGPGGGAAGLLLGHPALRLHGADGQQVSHATGHCCSRDMWLGAPNGGMSPDLGQPHAGTCGSLCPFPCWAPWASLGQDSAGVHHVSSSPVPVSPSFERLLLHALCQYMDLVSASSDIEGKRQMKVSNKHRVFLPPQLLLSDYLGQMS